MASSGFEQHNTSKILKSWCMKMRKIIHGKLQTVITIFSVLTVYAVMIGSFQGGKLTVGGVASAIVTYSLDNSEAGSWTTTLAPSGTSSSWYSRLDIDAGDYFGPVTITWQLQQKTEPSTWTDISGADATTTMTLAGTAENAYASSDGGNIGNYDWSTDVTTAGIYRVVVTVKSA
jgi:hypothetical protein